MAIACNVKCSLDRTVCCWVCDSRKGCPYVVCGVGVHDIAGCCHARLDPSAKDIDELARAALVLWGKDAQINMASEEAAELIVVLNHFRRGRSTAEDVMGEIADMEILLTELKEIFIHDDIYTKVINSKLEKLASHIDKALSNKK